MHCTEDLAIGVSSYSGLVSTSGVAQTSRQVTESICPLEIFSLAITRSRSNGHRDVSRDEAEAFGGGPDVENWRAGLRSVVEEPAKRVTDKYDAEGP